MAADSVIRIATRSCELALYQANLVKSMLEAGGYAAELVTFKTVGDKRLDEPLSDHKGEENPEVDQSVINIISSELKPGPKAEISP